MAIYSLYLSVLFASAVGAQPASLNTLPLGQVTALAENGNVAAETYLGKLYALGGGLVPGRNEVLNDNTAALLWLNKAAAAGGAEAQTMLGQYYLSYYGPVQRNPETARLWLDKAAQQNYAPALTELGRMYKQADGVTGDSVKALSYYHRAGELGDAQAEYELSLFYGNGQGGVETDAVAAYRWTEKAARQHQLQAENDLGYDYMWGRGTAADAKKAVFWLTEAASAGEPRAQYDLGEIYAAGNAVPKDKTKARYWLEKSAIARNPRAMSQLGNMDLYDKDYASALQWYQKAANAGSADGQHNMTVMYAGGFGVTQDWAQAFSWAQKAARQGFAESQIDLAWFYHNGRSVTPDMKMSYAWALLAQAGGDARADELLAKLHDEMTPEDVAAATNTADALAATITPEKDWSNPNNW